MLGFFLLLGLFAKVGINIQPPEHMKCSCGSYANKKTLLLLYLFFFFVFFFSFPSQAFLSSGPCSFFFFGREKCCLFEFSNLVVILKHSLRFINSMPYSMGDPLHPFMSALMTLVLKEIPFTSLTQNTLSLSLSSLCLLPQTLSPIYSDKPFHHDPDKRPRFFPP